MRTVTLAIVFSIGALHFSYLFAQELTTAETQAAVQSIQAGNAMFRSFDNRYKGLVGSVMVFENFMPGRLTMVQGQVVNKVKLNYDAYNNEIVIINNKQEVGVQSLKVKSFEMYGEDDTLKFVRVLGDDGKLSFYQSLIDGKVTLYKKYGKTLIEPNYKGAYSAGRDYAELKDNIEYYIQIKDAKPVAVKNKKGFIQLFPNQASGIEKFIKENKVNFKEETDLRHLVSFVNSLGDAL